MTSEVTVAILALIGTLAGTFGGILTSARLSNYRIEQLEKKVDRHNGLIERMVAVENSLKSAHKRIDELRGEVGNE
ncbi:MAG: hypothetical protein IJM97_01610 [Clostridia bacterium]|nr:hypothetical protein [Clostridia bacterium]MBQ6707628.1 hypothetical protein [Clostridia bacterium]